MNHPLVRVLFLSLLFTGHTALAADCQFKFKTGVNEDSAFFKRDASGQTSGLAWDFLKEISKRTGCEFQGVPMNYVHAYDQLKTSQIDVFAIVANLPKWDAIAEHNVLYSSDRVILLRKEGAPKSIVLAEVLKDKRIKFGDIIGAVLFFTEEEKKQLDKESRIVRLPNGDSAIAALLAGRVQALFVSPAYLNFLRKTGAIEKFAYVYDPEHPIHVGIYLSKIRMTASQRLLISNTIKSMRADGAFKKILAGYLPADDLLRYH